MNERFLMLLDPLIIVIPIVILGFIAEKVFKKISKKNVPENYYTYVIVGSFLIYAALRGVM